MLNTAEAAIPRADPSKNQNRCRPFRETLAQIRAPGLFTDRVKVGLAQDRLHFREILNGGDSLLQPGGFSQIFQLLWPRSGLGR